MPNTHRRRRRDETVESRRVGGVYTNSQLVGDSFVVSSVWTHPSAVETRIVNWLPTAVLCVRIRRQSSRIHVHTADVTRQNSFVASVSAVCIGLNIPVHGPGFVVNLVKWNGPKKCKAESIQTDIRSSKFPTLKVTSQDMCISAWLDCMRKWYKLLECIVCHPQPKLDYVFLHLGVQTSNDKCKYK